MIKRRQVLTAAVGAAVLNGRLLAMETRLYPPLSPDLKKQLQYIQSGDGIAYPCSVKTDQGLVMDRVYLAPAAEWIVHWGVWPEDDPAKRSVDVRQVVSISNSPTALPAIYAKKLYAAGESGMGYTVFTVVFSDGLRQAYATGNAIDFIDYPAGQSPATVADVLPHVGRDDARLMRGPDYSWCLFGKP